MPGPTTPAPTQTPATKPASTMPVSTMPPSTPPAPTKVAATKAAKTSTPRKTAKRSASANEKETPKRARLTRGNTGDSATVTPEVLPDASAEDQTGILNRNNGLCLHCEAYNEVAKDMWQSTADTCGGGQQAKGQTPGEACQTCQEKGLPCSFEDARIDEGESNTGKQYERAKRLAKRELALLKKVEDMQTELNKLNDDADEDVLMNRRYGDTLRKTKQEAMKSAMVEVDKYKADKIMAIDAELHEHRISTSARFTIDLEKQNAAMKATWEAKINTEMQAERSKRMQQLSDDMEQQRKVTLQDEKDLLASRKKKEADLDTEFSLKREQRELDLQKLMSSKETQLMTEFDTKRVQQNLDLEKWKHTEMTAINECVEKERAKRFAAVTQELNGLIVSVKAREVEVMHGVQKQFETWKNQYALQLRNVFESSKALMKAEVNAEVLSQVENLRGTITAEVNNKSHIEKLSKGVNNMMAQMATQEESHKTQMAEMRSQMENQIQLNTPVSATLGEGNDGFSTQQVPHATFDMYPGLHPRQVNSSTFTEASLPTKAPTNESTSAQYGSSSTTGDEGVSSDVVPSNSTPTNAAAKGSPTPTSSGTDSQEQQSMSSGGVSHNAAPYPNYPVNNGVAGQSPYPLWVPNPQAPWSSPLSTSYNYQQQYYGQSQYYDQYQYYGHPQYHPGPQQ
ncbi:hypothetical protein Z517_09300 [Fonsecaea pedrosoi CBS 271.37]|uniref:Unplaced genomic scaffold supercont1.6, whole genome shotgun sequence n=1 Tax=Fonsecaea pedrosoi CBS 271.37 TaxID=1442368 RepID=A0A0D2DGP2_9EURO|nr:uncharacterized protein Z517_09300 [Fonsecaea pedrosoi CBS 271.37]KIW76856.1 hypothetical protein Z517_09300 [Fonsecaea pedrosoi CBS 271.37]